MPPDDELNITRLHIRFTTTRLLLLQAIRLLPDTEAAIYEAHLRDWITRLSESDRPGSALIIDNIKEYVRHLDFIRSEIV